LIVFVQDEILEKHVIVLLAKSKTKMKGKQIPQSTKDWLWSLFHKYTILP